MLPAYEQMLESFYRSFLKSGDVVVDVGAHVGRHAFPCAEAVGKNGKVFCFEPLPAQYKILSDQVYSRRSESPLSFPEMVLYNFALGEKEHEANFVIVPDFPEYSGFKERKYHADGLRKEVVKVQVKPMDFFIKELENVKYIKVDAEGGELTILRGATEIISKFKPIVSFELGNASLINYEYCAADYFDFFADRNYSLYSIFGINLKRQEFIEYAEKQFFWDYIALPPGEEWPANHGPIKVLTDQLFSFSSSEPSTCITVKDSDDQAERRLQEILNSTSWRITAPLRFLKTSFFR